MRLIHQKRELTPSEFLAKGATRTMGWVVSAKSVGALAVLCWAQLLLPIHRRGATGFCVPAVVVGSGGVGRRQQQQQRAAGDHGRRDDEKGSSPPRNPRPASLRSSTTSNNNNAPFGHPNDEIIGVSIQTPQRNASINNNDDDEEAISGARHHAFVFPDVSYGRAFAVQGGPDSSSATMDTSSGPAIAVPAAISVEEQVPVPPEPKKDSPELSSLNLVVAQQNSTAEVAAGLVVQQVESTTIDVAAAPYFLTTDHAVNPQDLKETNNVEAGSSVVQAASSIVQAASAAVTGIAASKEEVVVPNQNSTSSSIGATPTVDPTAAEPVVVTADDDVDLAIVEEIRPPAFAMPEACPPAVAMPEIPVTVKTMLGSPAWKAPLAQIASAYQPGLLVENIREISIGTVDDTHLDVEALVCEEDGDDSCVTVKIPVDFLTSCFGAEDARQCVLDNIQQLSDVIKAEGESEVVPTDKTLLERERLLKEVVSPKFLEYPDWWSAPIVLAGECNALRAVLNDAECQPQLQRLFRQKSPKTQKIVRASLVAVGPCGVILRALDTKHQLHEVPIAFAVPATDAGRLRSAVLELFG
jgi:hypothetical protein